MPTSSMPRHVQPSLLLKGVNVVILFIVFVGTIPTFFSGGFALWSPGRIILYLISSGAYLAMAILGWELLIERRRRFGPHIYFTIQIPLVFYIQWLAFDLSGTSWILMMPIAGQSITLPRWGRILVPILLLGGFIWLLSQFIPLENAYNAIANISVAILFTMVFTYAAVREEESRVKVEQLANQLQFVNQQLREYAVQAEELATTKERNRLAREIHDTLGHYLTVINVQLEAAKLMLEGNPDRAREALDKSQTLAQEGLQAVRRSVSALRELPTDRLPLPEAIGDLIAENRSAGIVTEMQLLGEPRLLDPRVNLTLYRVVQEGLTNARKHARASRADILLDFRQDTAVSLTIRDNGIGAAQTDGGFGLLGLQERVNLLGGEMAVATAVRQGFTLRVTLPTHQPPLPTEQDSHEYSHPSS